MGGEASGCSQDGPESRTKSFSKDLSGQRGYKYWGVRVDRRCGIPGQVNGGVLGTPGSVSLQRYEHSGPGCIVKPERPHSSRQQLSKRPGVWSVPHQWGVQLWLRMKGKERIKGSQGRF